MRFTSAEITTLVLRSVMYLKAVVFLSRAESQPCDIYTKVVSNPSDGEADD